jgi:hypothetical protein
MEERMVMTFPSDENHKGLRRLSRKDGNPDSTLNLALLDEADRWHFHAYDYGWRRVVLDDRSDQSPLDPWPRSWFDEHSVAVAEAYWRRRLNRPAPDEIEYRAGPRSAEDIEWVTRAANRARAAIEAFTSRSKAAFRDPRNIKHLEREQTSLGIVAKPHYVADAVPDTIAGQPWHPEIPSTEESA